MTRKHYQTIAQVIQDVDDIGEYDSRTLRVLTRHLANAMLADNPRFDRDKFYEATGLFT